MTAPDEPCRYCGLHYHPGDHSLTCPIGKLEAEVAALREAEGDLKLALEWALEILGRYEPGDSRAVSDEFVSAYAVLCGLTDRREEARAILLQALKESGHEE